MKSTILKTIHFNSGRAYSPGGQHISATLWSDGIITFHDHTRMIDGELDFLADWEVSTEELRPAIVLGFYDRGQYFATERSGRDAMCGPNRTYKGAHMGMVAA